MNNFTNRNNYREQLCGRFNQIGKPICMALVPRWQYMTDESKALAKRLAISGAILVISLIVVRTLLPWVIAALVVWWLWKLVIK